MFLIERDIESWKNDMNDYQNKRKNVQWNAQERSKPITYSDVKRKDAEYNPVLQKYRQNEKVCYTLITNLNILQESLAVARETDSFTKNRSRAQVTLAKDV